MSGKDHTTVISGAAQRNGNADGTGATEGSKITEGFGTTPRILSDAAKRALAEADARRRLREVVAKDAPAELGGRDGPDPVRYGDWEKDGIISDF